MDGKRSRGRQKVKNERCSEERRGCGRGCGGGRSGKNHGHYKWEVKRSKEDNDFWRILCSDIGVH